MDTTAIRAVSKVVAALVANEARSATAYLGPKLTVKATRRMFGKKFNNRAFDIVLTVGKPNYRERDFIKRATQAGEPFPVKRVQLRYAK